MEVFGAAGLVLLPVSGDWECCWELSQSSSISSIEEFLDIATIASLFCGFSNTVKKNDGDRIADYAFFVWIVLLSRCRHPTSNNNFAWFVSLSNSLHWLKPSASESFVLNSRTHDGGLLSFSACTIDTHTTRSRPVSFFTEVFKTSRATPIFSYSLMSIGIAAPFYVSIWYCMGMLAQDSQ